MQRRPEPRAALTPLAARRWAGPGDSAPAVRCVPPEVTELWPCAEQGGRCGARWAAGGRWVTGLPRAGPRVTLFPFSPSPWGWGQPLGAACLPAGRPAAAAFGLSGRGLFSQVAARSGREEHGPGGNAAPQRARRPVAGQSRVWASWVGPQQMPRPGRRVSRSAVPSGGSGGAGELSAALCSLFLLRQAICNLKEIRLGFEGLFISLWGVVQAQL